MAHTGKKRAVFLDRDGTINIEKRYLADPDRLELFPDCVPALMSLMTADYLLFIVTNQSGIGRGYYTLEDMHRVNNRLRELLEPEGIRFERIYFAPEHPDEESRGRKPSPEFLLDAATEFDLDLTNSFMIGDKLSDVRCGWNAGVRESILVRTGYGKDTEAENLAEIASTIVVDTLSEAVKHILENAGQSPD